MVKIAKVLERFHLWTVYWRLFCVWCWTRHMSDVAFYMIKVWSYLLKEKGTGRVDYQDLVFRVQYVLTRVNTINVHLDFDTVHCTLTISRVTYITRTHVQVILGDLFSVYKSLSWPCLYSHSIISLAHRFKLSYREETYCMRSLSQLSFSSAQ